MLSCIEINSGKCWLPCELAIHAIAEWVFAVPLLCLSVLIRNRKDLDELWQKLQYGFLI